MSHELRPSGKMINGINSSVLMLFCLSDTVTQQLLVSLRASYQADCPHIFTRVHILTHACTHTHNRLCIVWSTGHALTSTSHRSVQIYFLSCSISQCSGSASHIYYSLYQFHIRVDGGRGVFESSHKACLYLTQLMELLLH